MNKVKEEPPEEFVIVLPSPDDDSTAQSEDDEKPLADVKEEPQEDSLLVLLSPPKDQPQQEGVRRSTRKRSNGRFTIKKDLRKPSRPKVIQANSSKLSLDRHLNEFHGAEFKCDKCTFHTTNSILLKSHKGTHSKPLVCSTCQKPYATNSAMKKHQKQRRHGIYENAPVIAYICDICDKSFSSPNYLRQHQYDTHDEEQVECEVCGKIYKNRNSLRKHSKIHDSPASQEGENGDEPQAEVKKEPQEDSVLVHLSPPKDQPQQSKAHKGTHSKPFTCSTCQKPYATNSAMRKHQKQRRHGIYENAPVIAYICDICDKSYSSPNYLRQHQNDVHDEKKVTCEVCGRICKNRKSLRSHSQSHAEQAVKCDVCGKIYKNWTLLRKHSKIHDSPALQTIKSI